MRVFAIASGLFGGATFSQLPEFTQQYMQRLGGAVDELSRMAAGFDTDAASLGLTRDAALAQLQQGGDMGLAQAERMQNLFDRLGKLTSDLAALQQARGTDWLLSLTRMRDPEIASAAWEVFKPAVPLTLEGAVCTSVGLSLGYVVWRGGAGLVRAGFRALRRPISGASA